MILPIIIFHSKLEIYYVHIYLIGYAYSSKSLIKSQKNTYDKICLHISHSYDKNLDVDGSEELFIYCTVESIF